MNEGDNINNITLKTNDVINSVHRYYSHTYDARITKELQKL
jgi:hypothetical protein